MNISERSYSPFPMRSNSDSRNPIVEKHQHVPVRFWFFTGDIFTSFTGVNTYPSLFSSCAPAVVVNA